jgi:ABC-type Fe3+-hydroxamate transport system substrate-binding protein
MLRRDLFAFGATAFLAACGTQSSLTPAQIIADAQGLVATVQATVATIIVANPTAIKPTTLATLQRLQALANAALSTLSGVATPASTLTALQTVEAYLNPALAAVGSALAVDPILNAKYGVAYTAAMALFIDVIEPYINSLAAGSPPAAPTTTPTAAAARVTLKIKTVP